VFARSGGNPFLAVELLSSPGVLGMHATVEHVLLARTRNLTPSGLDLLQLIAIFERPVSHDLLASCAAWDIGPLLSGLRENIASGLLTVDEHTEEYSFRHVLTREAVLHPIQRDRR
jgi:predicted ATPase